MEITSGYARSGWTPPSEKMGIVHYACILQQSIRYMVGSEMSLHFILQGELIFNYWWIESLCEIGFFIFFWLLCVILLWNKLWNIIFFVSGSLIFCFHLYALSVSICYIRHNHKYQQISKISIFFSYILGSAEGAQ